MNKRIIVLVLLLLNVFFYSCSTKKNATDINTKDIVLPVHSNNMNEELQNDGEKKDKYEKLKRKHFKSQDKSVQREMKKNEKLSEKNTPVRKKRSLFCRKKNCVNKVDEVMIKDGVSDVRP